MLSPWAGVLRHRRAFATRTRAQERAPDDRAFAVRPNGQQAPAAASSWPPATLLTTSLRSPTTHSSPLYFVRLILQATLLATLSILRYCRSLSLHPIRIYEAFRLPHDCSDLKLYSAGTLY